jgi:hypothetical protein
MSSKWYLYRKAVGGDEPTFNCQKKCLEELIIFIFNVRKSACYLFYARVLLYLLFEPVDGGNMFLQNFE